MDPRETQQKVNRKLDILRQELAAEREYMITRRFVTVQGREIVGGSGIRATSRIAWPQVILLRTAYVIVFALLTGYIMVRCRLWPLNKAFCSWIGLPRSSQHRPGLWVKGLGLQGLKPTALTPAIRGYLTNETLFTNCTTFTSKMMDYKTTIDEVEAYAHENVLYPII